MWFNKTKNIYSELCNFIFDPKTKNKKQKTNANEYVNFEEEVKDFENDLKSGKIYELYYKSSDDYKDYVSEDNYLDDTTEEYFIEYDDEANDNF